MKLIRCDKCKQIKKSAYKLTLYKGLDIPQYHLCKKCYKKLKIWLKEG